MGIEMEENCPSCGGIHKPASEMTPEEFRKELFIITTRYANIEIHRVISQIPETELERFRQNSIEKKLAVHLGVTFLSIGPKASSEEETPQNQAPETQ
jgi:hypothetical protein